MTAPYLKDYPKIVKLKDGRSVSVRLIRSDDRRLLHDFFLRLSEEDLLYLRDNVKNPAIVDKWFDKPDMERVIPIVAEFEGRIIADATLHMNPHSWYRHVGEIRLVVDNDFRRQGLGLLLAREIFFIALQLKLEKIQAEMPADQGGARRVFESLGFRQEAILQNHILDMHGDKRHLLIMSNHVSSLWDTIQDLYMDHFKDSSGMYAGAGE